jgi:hypothetical protein
MGKIMGNGKSVPPAKCVSSEWVGGVSSTLFFYPALTGTARSARRANNQAATEITPMLLTDVLFALPAPS